MLTTPTATKKKKSLDTQQQNQTKKHIPDKKKRLANTSKLARSSQQASRPVEYFTRPEFSRDSDQPAKKIRTGLSGNIKPLEATRPNPPRPCYAANGGAGGGGVP